MKANDYLIIPRSEIERRITELQKEKSQYKQPDTRISYINTKIDMLEFVKNHLSRPLSPILEKAWDCTIQAVEENIALFGDITFSNQVLNEQKQQFLDSDI